MRYIKLPLIETDYERLATIAAARSDKPSLPNLTIEALNTHLQLDPPISAPRKRGNPTGNKGRPIKQPPRGSKPQ